MIVVKLTQNHPIGSLPLIITTHRQSYWQPNFGWMHVPSYSCLLTNSGTRMQPQYVSQILESTRKRKDGLECLALLFSEVYGMEMKRETFVLCGIDLHADRKNYERCKDGWREGFRRKMGMGEEMKRGTCCHHIRGYDRDICGTLRAVMESAI